MPAGRLATCFRAVTPRFLDWGKKRELTRRFGGLSSARNEGRVTDDQYHAEMLRIKDEHHVMVSKEMDGGRGLTLIPITRLARSSSPAVREAAQALLSDASRPAYLGGDVGAAESLARKLRAEFDTRFARADKDLGTAISEGKTLPDKAFNYGRAIMSDSMQWAWDMALGIVSGGGHQPGRSWATTFRRDATIALARLMYGRPGNYGTAVETAGKEMQTALAELNERLVNMGLPEEETAKMLPAFVSRDTLRVGKGGKTAFVTRMTGERFEYQAMEEGVMTKGKDKVVLTAQGAEDLYRQLVERSSRIGYESELPQTAWVRLGEEAGSVNITLDVSRASGLDDFLQFDATNALRRYTELKTGRAALRKRDLVEPDNQSYALSPRVLNAIEADRRALYVAKHGKDRISVDKDGTVMLDGKAFTDPDIDVPLYKDQELLERQGKLLAGMAPDSGLLSWLSDPLGPYLRFMQKLNLTTMMGRISISAGPDLANVIHVARPQDIGRFATAWGPYWRNRLPEQVVRDLRAMAIAQESIAGTAIQRAAGVPVGSVQQRQDPANQLLDFATRHFGFASGINYMNDNITGATYAYLGHAFAEEMVTGQGNHALKYMAQYGLGDAAVLSRVRELVKQHGVISPDGTYTLGIERWTDGIGTVEGVKKVVALRDEVAAAFHQAAFDNTLLPPQGVIPDSLNNPVGRSILQFRSILFASWVRLVQRPINRGSAEPQELVSFVANLALAAAAMEAKFWLAGRPVPDDSTEYFMAVGAHTSTLAGLWGILEGVQAFVPGVDVPGIYGPNARAAGGFAFGPNLDRLRDAGYIYDRAAGISNEGNPMAWRALGKLVPYNNHPFVDVGKKMIYENK